LDAVGDGVGHRAFETVTDLDSRLAILGEDEENDAVVLPRLSNPPFTEGLNRELLQSEILRHAPIDPDDELVGGVLLELLERRVQTLGAVGRQSPDLVGDVARRLWRKEILLPRREERDRREEDAEDERDCAASTAGRSHRVSSPAFRVPFLTSPAPVPRVSPRS